MHFESASFKMIDVITHSFFDPGPMPPRYDTTDYRPKPTKCNILTARTSSYIHENFVKQTRYLNKQINLLGGYNYKINDVL